MSTSLMADWYCRGILLGDYHLSILDRSLTWLRVTDDTHIHHGSSSRPGTSLSRSNLKAESRTCASWCILFR